MDLLEFMVELHIQYYLVLKNMMLFTIELDILSGKKVVSYIFLLIIL